ncbi:MAG: hypothetical protein U0232_19085 [Thermomicrobiales bacterium]
MVTTSWGRRIPGHAQVIAHALTPGVMREELPRIAPRLGRSVEDRGVDPLADAALRGELTARSISARRSAGSTCRAQPG